MSKVLVVDDDRTVQHLISRAFADDPIEVLTAGTAREGLERIQADRPDVALLDIMLPEITGLELFKEIQQIDSKLPVIFITAGGTSETAIEAMKLGAYDYLLKPLDLNRTKQLIRQAQEIRRLMHVPVSMPESTMASSATTGDLLVGRSPQMQAVYKAIGRVAPQTVTVLIRGESGTGKELIARAIYQHSTRSDGPFLAVNCAAIPEALLESELFGHEKGSFTGADTRRIGKFEQCHGGTLFLDEVGDMSPLVQSKVLRALQEQKFERVGGNKTIETDVRVIAATNRELEQMVEANDFRSDLYYRLNGFTIDLPPLRERGGDLTLILEHFLVRFNHELGKEITGISPEAMKLLTEYPWPGNVRELQSVLRQALLQTTGTVLLPEFLPEVVLHGPQKKPATQGPAPLENDLAPSDLRGFVDDRLYKKSNDLYAETLEMMERYLITRVLNLTEGNQSKAAKILGITRGSLRNKVRSLGVSIDQVVKVDDEDDSDE